MVLFYGTGNTSKLRNMRALLEGMPIELVSPLETGIDLPTVEEDGETPWENARKKAIAYQRATGLPSMGLDSGLYIQGISPELQPGTHVRRRGAHIMNDDEFIEYYTSLARKNGGRVKARFINGLCVVLDENHIKCTGGSHISTDWFWIVAEPHPTRLPGFPMDSIAVNPVSGNYWVCDDLEKEQTAKGNGLAQGIRHFFAEMFEDNFQSYFEEEYDHA